MLHIVVHQYRARCYISDAVNKNISRIGSNQIIQSVVSEGIAAQVRPLPVCLDASRRSRAPGWTSCCGAAGQSAWRAGRSPGRSCRSQRCSTDSCWWSPRRDTEKQEGTHLARNGKRKFIKCLLVTYMQKKRQTETTTTKRILHPSASLALEMLPNNTNTTKSGSATVPSQRPFFFPSF